MITNYAKNKIMLLSTGSSTSPYISNFIIGTGSSVVTSSDTTLVTATDKQVFTSVSYPSSQKVTFQSDWNSVEISGTQLSEMGLVGSAVGLTGSIWSRLVIPSLTFDGSNELRIEETVEFF